MHERHSLETLAFSVAFNVFQIAILNTSHFACVHWTGGTVLIFLKQLLWFVLIQKLITAIYSTRTTYNTFTFCFIHTFGKVFYAFNLSFSYCYTGIEALDMCECECSGLKAGVNL